MGKEFNTKNKEHDTPYTKAIAELETLKKRQVNNNTKLTIQTTITIVKNLSAAQDWEGLTKLKKYKISLGKEDHSYQAIVNIDDVITLVTTTLTSGLDRVNLLDE
jgi:hypothetical protein